MEKEEDKSSNNKTSKPYDVVLTMIHNATVRVHAESQEAAISLVHNNLDELAPDSVFQFGEKTVDDAEIVKD